MTYIIFILALIPRIIFTDRIPPSLNWDEISQGYNAYSIIKTGRDEWGFFLPHIFRAYGDFKLPLYTYLSTIPIFFLGLNPISIRLISILAGSLSASVVFHILKQYLGRRSIAIIGALIFSFSPWSIFLSRIALEANLFLLLFLLSFYFLISSKFSLSSLFFGLSLLTYNSSRVMLPFYIVAIVYLMVKHHQPIRLISHLPLMLSLILVLMQSLSPSGQARFQWVSLIDQGAINRIEELQRSYPRILVNKITYFVYLAGHNYLSHFNPVFIFRDGGSHYQFNIPSLYLISPLLIPLVIAGTFALRHYPAVAYFLLISPIPSSITRDAPHTLRSIVFVAIVTIISTLGSAKLLRYSDKTKYFLYPYLLLTIIISLAQFFPRYALYSKEYSSSWQYGYQQVINQIKPLYHQYNKIIFTKKYGEPHEFVAFYWPWDPTQFQQQRQWDYHSNWYWTNSLDKFHFVNDWEIGQLSPSQSTLLITSPNNYPTSNARIIGTVKFLDSTTAFEIVSYD